MKVSSLWGCMLNWVKREFCVSSDFSIHNEFVFGDWGQRILLNLIYVHLEWVINNNNNWLKFTLGNFRYHSTIVVGNIQFRAYSIQSQRTEFPEPSAFCYKKKKRFIWWINDTFCCYCFFLLVYVHRLFVCLLICLCIKNQKSK